MKESNLQKITNSLIKTSNKYYGGLACLASIINYFGGEVSLAELIKYSGTSVEGINVLRLCNTARAKGLDANAYKGDLDFLKGIEAPVILYVLLDSGLQNFIVVFGWQNNKYIVGDPGLGIIEYREDELLEIWKSKSFISIVPNDTFQLKKKYRFIHTKWILESVKKQKKYLYLIAGISTAIAIIWVVLFPYFVQQVMSIFKANAYSDNLFELVLLLCTIFILGLLNYLKQGYVRRGVQLYVKTIFVIISEKLANATYIDNRISAGKASLLEKATKYVGSFLFQFASKLPFLIILTLASLFAIFSISVILGIILLSNLACLFALVWLNHKLLEKMTFYRYQADQRKVDFLMVGLFDYLRTNLLGNEKRMVTNVSSALTESFAIEQEIEKRQSFIDYTLLVFSLISFVAFVFVVNFMGYFGKWMNISFWLLLFTWTVTKMKSILIKYYSSKVSFRFINEIFKTKANYFVEESSETKSSLIAEFNNVLVKNVSISFPGKLPVLDNICFSIQKGEITVIYGSTGKGKSLLVSVLSRFLQPNKGEITIDGKNWNNFNDIQWRNSISVVNQPIRFFNATVLGNIGWGVIPFKVDGVITFCKEMGFDKFIADFSDDYTTFINDNVGISAGQVQLVAIAAALFRKPKFLILDEPLTYMDEEMKMFCIELFRKVRNEVPILIFSGDSGFKDFADKVYYL